MGYLGATLTQVFTHTRGADVSLRDVTIAQMRNGVRECEYRHTPEARRGFWEFWRKLVELRTRHRTRRVDFRGSLRPDEFTRYGHLRETRRGRWKSQNRKNVYLSSLCRNSKVKKGFVPELRSRYVFFVFRDSYVLCIYVMNILCTFHIFRMAMLQTQGTSVVISQDLYFLVWFGFFV